MAAANTLNGTSEVKDEFISEQHDEDEEDLMEAEELDNVVDAALAAESADEDTKKWPGWPGDSVFRLIVPVLKVGSIIGRKGELIKKLCEETRARVRILEGAIGTNDRIVLISAKEEPDSELSPAMDAVLRVFKRINGLLDGTGESADDASTTCSVRLLVSSPQAINLIGKQGVMIKSIQESTGATIRVLSGDELPYYATGDERVVDIHGETLKVLKTLEAVAGHLRKFLVDHGVLPLFEKSLKNPAVQDREPDEWSNKTQSLMHSSQTGIGNEYELPVKRSSLYHDHEPQLDSQFQRSSLSLYGQDPALSGLRSSGSGLGRTGGPLVTQVTQTMQIPLSYAEDIIGIGGGNIAYIRRTSGAVLTVQETRGIPDEITVEIKGSASQVQMAQQLIQEFIAGHKDPAPSSYGSLDTGLRSSYSHLGRSDYSSSLSASSLGGYGSSGLGGYGSYRF
ncbi:RNA-binding KH domain-containing protein PEPPER [Dendrobium catenatum]|uniref:KH domain-containing protein n=1 Tax=Dendrobium catenatum TaxID=906689 RepID=A0A2I0X0Z2_9ASPA|nr:RNA-binding KH domain-containing protein PEPPER [Dendrobium catenatum]PKU81584.1 KH domain-containing protein [Dendrobium catenatum]